MTDAQSGAWVLTLSFSVLMAVVVMAAPKARVFPIVGYGVLLMFFGAAFSCLTGTKCVDVITLEDAGGFGRAYSAGIVLLISGIVLLVKKAVVSAIKNKSMSDE